MALNPFPDTARWYRYDPSQALPEVVSSAVSASNAATSAISGALSAMKEAFQIAAAIAITRIDPIAELLDAAANAAAEVVETLNEAGLYFLWDFPASTKLFKRPTVWIDSVVSSMTDEGDRERPDFLTRQNVAGGIVMFVGLDPGALVALGTEFATAFGRLMKRSPAYPSKEQIQAAYGVNRYGPRGLAPDWERVTLDHLVGGFGAVSSVMRRVHGLFTTAANAADLLLAVVPFLESKIGVLNDLAEELEQVLQTMEALVVEGPVHVLWIEGTFTTAELGAAIRSAGLPGELGTAADDTLFGAGFALLSIGGSGTAADLLQGLFVGDGNG